jgi:hypothetical protein
MALVEGEVDGVIGACVFADIVNVTSAWEVVLKLMKGAGHDAVREIERLLHAIPVMDIDVYIEHALISFKQFENSQNTVVDVAEAGSLGLFGVM